MKTLASFFILLLFISCQTTPQYDVVIRNGTLYDGTGQAPSVGDVAILNGRIAALGKVKGKGKTELDATGKAVSPGFINMLSWANESLLFDGRSQSDIRQGVTLEVMGEGRSMGPLNPQMKNDMQENQGEIKYEVTWTRLGEYLQHLEDKGVSTNVASFVGNGTLRTYVMGYESRQPGPEELQQMKDLLEAEMKAGAVGVSSSLLYAPSMHANTRELTELAKVAAKYNGMYISHIRDEGDSLIESINELIEISRQSGIKAEVYHLKASSAGNWHKMDSVIQLINAARTEGLPITADMYTYNASSTGLHVILPQWVRKGGVEDMLEKLSNADIRKKAVNEIVWRTPPDGILFVGFRNPELRKFQGKRLNEVADAWQLPPGEAAVELMLKDQSRVQVVYFSMSEENIDKKIQLPWMSFCSDAGSYTAEGAFLERSTHPRAYGSFIRVLGLFSRDKKLFPLEEAVRKLSGLPAQNLGLKDRGLLKENFYADIVIFDPQKVQDHATFEAPHQYATGIEQVFVNGVQVLKDGDHTGATPGKFVKGPGAVQ